MRKSILINIAIALFLLSGCGFFNLGSDPSHADAGSTNPLEAPPDLVTPAWDKSLEIPKTANDRVSALETQGPALGAPVLPEFVSVRVRREGPTTWLEVDSDPVTLWPVIRRFWQDEDYPIGADEPLLGYVETEWKQHTHRSFNSETNQEGFDITNEKFRIRLERQPNAATNVFLTHRGAEVAEVNRQNQILWRPQPPNGEREAEMMIRLMEFLGSTHQEAVSKLAGADAQFLYLDIKNIGGVPVLVVGDIFSRVWRRTGVALDRSGLVVEDYNRNEGTYFVAVDSAPVGMPSNERAKTREAYYEIHLLGKGKQTLITAHRMHEELGVIDPDTARQLLKRVVQAYPGSYPNS